MERNRGKRNNLLLHNSFLPGSGEEMKLKTSASEKAGKKTREKK